MHVLSPFGIRCQVEPRGAIPGPKTIVTSPLCSPWGQLYKWLAKGYIDYLKAIDLLD